MTTPYIQQDAWARVVFGISVAAFAIGEISQAVKRRRGASGADLRSEVVFRVFFFAGILMLPLAQTLVPGAVLDGRAVFGLGALVGWLGLLLRWWSFATLGKYFTVVVKTSPDQLIVSDGPYRLLRHPSYTGLLAALLGCGLMMGNWAGTCVSYLLILTALIYRLLREERTMINALGDGYRDFARHRARLLPFVW
ncbi:methyltransferase family protein [Actinopolymorpha singaporensis]|uniref:Protein-S-isoprenylcysteine O-methyltransferase Ste14 n=1 Tax=Actinopolymorpha singaporensis TaxID=117157 RepID=A0A1H1P8F4_9ACTN|nr:isoprenylcysteine carboxylmethyltransferase family protein [Actinopolymorpha singaporensis]SDS07477.1 Protein-S-isoprenylcysteine O-methyltransferase Ste14 [Actinopolymorpha singaporensis]